MTDFEASQEFRADIVTRIEKGTFVDQTFRSRHARLNGIQLWMRLGEEKYNPQDKLNIQLFRADNPSTPQYSTEISYDDVNRYFPITVHFPAIEVSQDSEWIIRFSTLSSPVQIFGRNENAYPEGELRLDGQNQQADIAFRLLYDYDLEAFASDVRSLALKGTSFLFALIILYLPGRIFLFPIMHSSREHALFASWAARTALSISLSLVLFPILFLWTSSIGIRWNIALSVVYISLVSSIYLWFKVRSWRRKACLAHLTDFSQPTNLALIAIFLVTLFIRFAMVRDLSAPAWVDSVHHGLITRLILEQGALPASYDPYIPIAATYHPGFHAVVALFIWLTHTPIHHAILLIGQLFNSLIIFSVFLFGFTLTRQPWVGVFAALATAVVSPMPAYYASWGRYTHLAGMLILPACLALWNLMLEAAKQFASRTSGLSKHLPILLLTALSIAGLSIVHFRLTLFMLLLLATELTTRIFSYWRSKKDASIFFSNLFAISLCGCLALFLALPWWDLGFVQQVVMTLSRNRGTQQLFYDFNLGYLTTGWGKDLLILSAAGLVWSFLRKRRFGLTIFLWLLLMFITANLGVIQAPGAGFITNASVIISLFLPMSMMAGYLFFDVNALIAPYLPRLLRMAHTLLIAVFLGIILFRGAQNLMPILNPITILYRQQDDPAMEFIRQNVPEHETILINSFSWGYGVYAGNDGGFWIAPLTGRITFPPPVLYGLGGTQLTMTISTQSQASLDAASDAEKLYRLMEELSIDYVYLGRKGGAFSAQILSNSPLFTTVYAQDGCWLFRRRDELPP